MNKKLLALAVATAFVAPVAAQADTGNVTIYGKLHYSLDYGKADNTDASPTPDDSNLSVSSNSSRIGFKGTEDLGNGLKLGWQIENLVAMDEAAGGGNGWGARDSYVTLGGSWGTYLVGKVDATYKSATGRLDVASDTIGDMNNILVLDPRVDHAGAYISPKFNGFQFVLGFVPDGLSNTAANSSGGGGADNNDFDAWAATISYDNGPLYVALTGARLSNDGAAVNDETEKDWKIGAGYNFGQFKVGAIFEDRSDIGGVDGADQQNWLLNGEYTFGNNSVFLQYAKADDLDTVANTGADLIALGVKHNFSKRTQVYAMYAQMDNEDNGTGTGCYRLGGGGHGDSLTPGRDTNGNCGDSDAFSVGIVHLF